MNKKLFLLVTFLTIIFPAYSAEAEPPAPLPHHPSLSLMVLRRSVKPISLDANHLLLQRLIKATKAAQDEYCKLHPTWYLDPKAHPFVDDKRQMLDKLKKSYLSLCLNFELHKIKALLTTAQAEKNFTEIELLQKARSREERRIEADVKKRRIVEYIDAMGLDTLQVPVLTAQAVTALQIRKDFPNGGREWEKTFTNLHQAMASCDWAPADSALIQELKKAAVNDMLIYSSHYSTAYKLGTGMGYWEGTQRREHPWSNHVVNFFEKHQKNREFALGLVLQKIDFLSTEARYAMVTLATTDW